MGRLLGGMVTLAVYFCAATLLSELIILAYLWSAWKLDPQRLHKAAAVARGIEPTAPAAEEPAPPDLPPEEVSFDEILDRRALKVRDLELREIALRTATGALAARQSQLIEEQQKLASQSAEFESRLSTLKDGAMAQGREAVRRILETLKPAQAKAQIMAMLDKGELDEVVMLLSGMQESKQAKILGEFKAAGESDKVAELLERIRQGQPEASLADSAQAAAPRATTNQPGGT